MRAYPSAAAVATPSKSVNTQRMRASPSSAATRCISEVPGFGKQASIPPATSVSTKLFAPFIGLWALTNLRFLLPSQIAKAPLPIVHTPSPEFDDGRPERFHRQSLEQVCPKPPAGSRESRSVRRLLQT